MPFSNTEAIGTAAILLSSGTALCVAYLHRKQMRQIELHRVDPSVGLHPPSNYLWAFLKRHWSHILGIGAPVWGVGYEVTAKPTEPVTRWTVVYLAFCVGMFFFNILMFVLHKIVKLMIDMIDQTDE